ncbi:hypothetical protein GMORB2_1822 [Geosmithia morbida]|uniref:Uncharacterized protein n=1 Tax=Geosmithia morbida TaxID=1094350 RepID=A0A9P5D336_9HYPO|nr:uncharacterized protein GMORB2_1822 [Geosmithia morbida]KAF4121415.1 hypothetical protein GMORB2_1822 [Geosmithia morbida]
MRIPPNWNISKPSAGTWLAVFLRFVSVVRGVQVPLPGEKGVCASFVSLTCEKDLSDVVVTVTQLEEAFNSDHQYHWVFFGTDPLSEEFRRITSNATSSACFYEVIPRNHWRFDIGFCNGRGGDYCSQASEDPALDINTLFPHIWSSIDEDPSLLLEDSHIPWLLGFHDDDDEDDDETDELGANSAQSYKIDVSEGIHLRPVYPEAGWKQSMMPSTTTKVTYSDDDDITWTLAEEFKFWLVSLCEDNWSGGAFELGFLAFLRSPGHEAFMDHLGMIVKLGSKPVDIDAFPAHTISASMLLPKQSVRNFRRGVSRCYKTGSPTTLPGKTEQAETAAVASAASSGTATAVVTAMEVQLAKWDQLAQDILRQSSCPGLRSGNTVIDERSFSLVDNVDWAN